MHLLSSYQSVFRVRKFLGLQDPDQYGNYFYGSGPFHQQAKQLRKSLILTVLFYDLLSVKTAVNVRVPVDVISKKPSKKTYFLL